MFEGVKRQLKRAAIVLVILFFIWQLALAMIPWGLVNKYAEVIAGGFLLALVLLLDVILEQPRTTSGREPFEVGWFKSRLASLRSSMTDSQDVIEVDGVYKKDTSASTVPKIATDTSTLALGQTGKGKSTFVKSLLDRWELDQAIIAHALSEGPGFNEFEQYFRDRLDPDLPIYRLSSQDSTHRWDPFLDFEQSMQDMKSIADDIWEARDSVETGWADAARSMLVCALAVTSARHDDFGMLPQVLEEDPQTIVEEADKIPRSAMVTSSLKAMEDDDLRTAYSNLLTEIQPLLLSEIFDTDLPRFSLTDYFDDPAGAVVLDNVRGDTFARPFWRFFVQTAIDKSMRHTSRQQFLLDEVDKIPRIDNLDELASAGRSADSAGILVAQDIHQLRSRYPDLADSIFANCPNRVIFAPGETETAQTALQSIGRQEVVQRSVNSRHDELNQPSDRRNVSTRQSDEYPITERELTRLDVGEALIQSPKGWWLGKIANPDR